ncbi:radical SAM/SPASM domain-containing protein [Pedobacter antarcticus]|uniref:radical SAM/SPASM domain-containing protein n=1 Tax=Pedobacter antarcticus TaxID=34086 RepID=UPI00292F08E7|nr:radical SAM protein [Pedobacter antarcticus]
MEVHYLDVDVISVLRENGMIISSDLDEFAEVKKRAAHSRESMTDSSTLFLCISPTNSCNMKCPYCFQGDKSSKNRDTKYLNEESINNLKQLVLNAVEKPHSTRIEKISIEWFGGEPLMQKNVIKEFSKFVLDICERYNLDFYASIITNASLLDIKTWKLLEECKIFHLQVTIDGQKDMHNQVRFYGNGQGSYDDIMINLSNMPLDNFDITIRINGDKIVFEKIPDLLQDLEARGFWPQRSKQIMFHWAPKFYNFLGHNQDKDMYYTSYEYQKSKQDFELMRVNYFNDWAVRFGSKNKRLNFAYPNFASFYCSTVESANSFSIDDGGYIHKCYNTVNSKDKRIEHVTEFNGENPALNYYKKFDKTEQADCRTCKVLPICDENCNMRFVSNAESKICSPWKYFMEERMTAIYEQKFSKDRTEDKLYNGEGEIIAG